MSSVGTASAHGVAREPAAPGPRNAGATPPGPGQARRRAGYFIALVTHSVVTDLL